MHRKIIESTSEYFFPNDRKSNDNGGCTTFASSRTKEKRSEGVKTRATHRRMIIKRMKFIDFERKQNNKAVTADKNANFRNFFQIS